jgi:hypothetical protein
MTDEKIFFVHYENGGQMQVFARDKEDAIERFYQAIESIIGHSRGECSCTGKKFDRSKVVRVIKVDGPFEVPDEFKTGV